MEQRLFYFSVQRLHFVTFRKKEIGGCLRSQEQTFPRAYAQLPLQTRS
ncbi:MAG: hypothetical protein ACI87W_001987 [Halieaceae bacterium]|jgi:hypothetical protein